MGSKDIGSTIQRLNNLGFTVMNWKPGSRRIFRVLDSKGNAVSEGMYSSELYYWLKGYLASPLVRVT